MKNIFLFFIFIFSLHGENIDSFNSEYKITKDIIYVTEKIIYNFTSEKHGMFREIPTSIRYRGERVDLHFSEFKVFQNGELANYTTNRENDKITIKIGSRNKLVKGRVTYVISYAFKTPIVPLSNRDIVSLNVVGTKWQVPISSAVATIDLMPEVSRHSVEIKTFSGYRGSKTSSAKVQWQGDKKLSVSAKELLPYQGVTVDIKIPKGIAQENIITVSKINYFVGAFIVFVIFYLRKLKDKFSGFSKLIITPQYMPPEGLSLLESKLINEGFISMHDFPAVIIELAIKGYIKIVNEDNITLTQQKKHTSKLTKTQRRVLHELFNKKSKIVISKEKISKGFAERIQDILSATEKYIVDKGYAQEVPRKSQKSFFFKSLYILVPLVFYFVFTLIPYSSDIYFTLIFIFTFGILGFIFLVASNGIIAKIISLLFITMAFLPLFSELHVFKDLFNVESEYFLNYFKKEMIILFSHNFIAPMFGIILILVYSVKLTSSVNNLTPKGVEAKEYLLGFKEFISRVEVDKIERLLKDDPIYLDKIMPYAMIFGYEKKYLNLYKMFDIPIGNWYKGDISNFNSFSSSVINYSTPARASSSSSGSSSGSGGSSGGGSGGGGGGSW